MTKVTGDSRLQSDVLEDLSGARRYRAWLADLIRPHLGEHPVEIGSGTGEYALEWMASVATLTVTEADRTRFEALQQRFAGNPAVAVRYLLLGSEAPPEPTAYSAAVALNVLEHIPDDVAALRDMAELVRPGGAVVLVVPAFPSAMSRFDHAIGHQRRYTKHSLSAALRAAGLEVELVRYINPVGLLIWYVAVKGLRMQPGNGPALSLYDRVIVPVARLAARFSVPFGQSVFAVARVALKTGQAETATGEETAG